LLYQRRPCSDLANNPVCAEPDPPHADFPNGWGGFADALHVDFKFPSEHTIYGQRFDGEMQVYHLHPGRRRLPVVSVMIQAARSITKGGDQVGHNLHLQEVIDEFQHEFDENAAHCLYGQEERMLVESPFRTNFTSGSRRRLSQNWHPYHESVMPSYYFFGYDGSLTEPPCTGELPLLRFLNVTFGLWQGYVFSYFSVRLFFISNEKKSHRGLSLIHP
jgi:hypothetical protein